MSEKKGERLLGEEPLSQILHSKELTLRPYDEKADMEAFYKMFRADKPFLRSLEAKERGKEFKRRFLHGRVTLFTGYGEFSFVIERNADKAVMGFIHLDSNYTYSRHVLTIDYYMGVQYRRQGYMEKALSMVIACGFKGKLYQVGGEGKKNRRYTIYAFKASADLDNIPSNCLLDKLGFVSHGIEYCARANDGWPVRDRMHYCLENPKHPPKRAYDPKDYGSFIFRPKIDSETGLAILPPYQQWDY